VNDNFRELLEVVAVLVLLVSLVNVVSVLFLVFTGTSTSIWIFAVPSKNVEQACPSEVSAVASLREQALYTAKNRGLFAPESHAQK